MVATRPFQIMGMDILTELPETENGNKHIILFTDYYTKWVEAFAIPDRTATTVAVKLIQGILCRHGAPEKIISDRDSSFISDVFREITEMLNIKQSMTTAYNPQADGQAEKAIGTLHNTLAKLVNSNQKNWDSMIPYALWAYRTAVHNTTKETPYFLVYGRDPVNPIDVRIRQWVETHPEMSEFTQTTVNRLAEARDRVIKTTQLKKEEMKKKYDRNRQDNPFNRGDLVWLKNNKKTPTENRKLMPKFEGPYLVINKIQKGDHDLNVDIQHTNDKNKMERVSIRRLKKAHIRPRLTEEYLKMLPSEKQQNDTPTPLINNKNEEKIEKESEITTLNTGNVINRKGRNIWTQNRRATKEKRTPDKREEYEVDYISDMRENPKTKAKEYKVHWLGWNKPTWEHENNVANAKRKVTEFKQEIN